jgi:hypothetical protein
VLFVVLVGWVVLRAPHAADAGRLLIAMAGLNPSPALRVARYTDEWFWVALAVGVFAAGPLVASISRWRVSIDAATTSLLMMIAATGVFLWRGPAQVILIVRGSRTTISNATRRGGGSDR